MRLQVTAGTTIAERSRMATQPGLDGRQQRVANAATVCKLTSKQTVEKTNRCVWWCTMGQPV